MHKKLLILALALVFLAPLIWAQNEFADVTATSGTDDAGPGMGMA